MASNVRFVDSLKVGSYQTQNSGGGGGSGITINNNVDNYLLSATGNPSIINGESNLQFDGQTLTVKGNIVRATLDKCKVSDAYKHESQFYLMNGIGVDNERTVLDLAISVGVVKKGGAWYTWADPTTGKEHKGQGLDGFRKLLPDSWLDVMFGQVRVYLTSKKKEDEPEINPEASSNLSDDGQKAMDELDDLFK